MPVYLKSIEDIRGVTWARSYLWDIKFDSAPSPFNVWFPATEVEEGLLDIQSKTVSYYLSDYNIPYRTGIRSLSITFYDNEKLVLRTWLKNWYTKNIENEGNGLTPYHRYVGVLRDVARSVWIAKLTPEREQLSQTRYWVYPDATVTNAWTSGSDILLCTVNFTIVGQGDTKG